MDLQLKETLRSLCCNNGWSYGVFWCANRRNCMLLTLEDAYYEEKVRNVINKMWQQTHMMGEGIIGRVAFVEKHRWMFADAYCGNWGPTGLIDNQVTFQESSEFQGQFSSGIKTIAVIPVAPLGVIQFGSTEKILESLEFVDHAKNSFWQLRSAHGLLSNDTRSDSKSGLYDPYVLHPSVASTGKYCSSSWIEPMHYENCNHIREGSRSANVFSQSSLVTADLHDVRMTSLMSSPSFHLKKQLQMDGADAQAILLTPKFKLPQTLPVTHSTYNSSSRKPSMCSWNNKISALTLFEQQLLFGMGMHGSPSMSSPTADTLISCRNGLQKFQEDSVVTHGRSGLLDTEKLTGYDSEINADIQHHFETKGGQPIESATFQDFEGELSSSSFGLVGGGILNGIPDSNAASSLENPVSILDSLICDADDRSLNDSMHVGADNPFDTLGLDFGFSQDKDCWDDILKPLGNDGNTILSATMSECITDLDVGSMIDTQKGFFSDFGVEQLLNELVDNPISVATKPSSEEQQSTSAVTRAASASVFSNQIQSTSTSCLGGSTDSLPPKRNQEKPDMQRAHQDIFLKSHLGSWVEDSYSINSKTAVGSQPKEPGQPTKISRKRARPGESTRPRPKDRQQIQDRLKELREIIPNGAKCSIDSLLDRTIKHMLFLQGASKYAKTLKQADEPKMITEGSGVILKDNSSSGSTWAFEVGGQTMLCPIIVEDLNPPGQMLIEMLCEERGLFLEIAETIQGFGLTILKGLMEARDNKIWARFVVEANRVITRMDMFLSLVQLLQQP